MTIDEIGETASLLDAMAMGAATIYYDNATKFGIGRYPVKNVRSTRNWSKFMKIARMCLASKVPVDKFVTQAFSDVMSRHAIVTVQDICSCDPKSTLRDESVLYSESSPRDLWNMLSCKLIDMVFSLDGAKGKSDILDNTMHGFPAWFRVFALEKPEPQLIVHWGDIADEELKSDPRLDEYLKSKRPETYGLLKSVMSKV